VDETLKELYCNVHVHIFCPDDACDIESIRDISIHLDRFVNELSRVLFLKENLYHKSWWLSVFYSLCIHSYVRRILNFLARNETPEPTAFEIDRQGIKRYLHLAVRLFIAASGSHDPLSVDYSLAAEPHGETSAEQIGAYQAAQRAVKQSKWEEQHIHSSGEYLKHIFEDSGGSLDEPLSSKAGDDMSADGMSRSRITNPQLGSFQCMYPGCTATPFHTQVSIHPCTNLKSIPVLT
jgi:hypothetical protein